MKRIYFFCLAQVLSAQLARPAFDATAAEPAPLAFGRDVQPILQQFCWKCHGPEKQKGGLRLDGRMAALSAGDSANKAIVPGRSSDSELIRRVETTDPDERMPPKSEPLSRDQIRILRTWIDQGAPWSEAADEQAATGPGELVITEDDRQHWSYQPLRAIVPPVVKDATWASTPVDRFILASLEARQILPNPSADRRTLIRRVYFDVLGLPPPPEEIVAFVRDESPLAYEALVDRLLGSSHYGERWGRHWLDLARYADSAGLETDADRPDAYHYRDFVIHALNDDLSYQTFVRWQLAGDEYEPDNPQALAATGFLTAAPNEVLDVPMEEEKLRLRYNELDDMAVTTVSTFLGLTLGCARCHDHKYDAIPTRDYYRLQCAFTNTSRDNVPLATRSDAAKYRRQLAESNARLASARNRLNDWLAQQKNPQIADLQSRKIDGLPIRDEDKRVLKEQPESAAAQALRKVHGKALRLSDEEYRQAFTDTQRAQWKSLRTAVDAAKRVVPNSLPTALAIAEPGVEPQPTWLLDRGDFYARKSPVQLGFLSVLTRTKPAEAFRETARRDVSSPTTSLQRRALAEWLTDVDDGAGALLARVIVNRVWQHHFGEGLVRTVSDFGVRGEPPTHPDLLEWLAHDFVASGWRLKRLHRQILTSSAYCEGTEFDTARSQLDPENRLLWRRRPKRLEAESLRDAVLAVSGTLNFEPFGPAFKPPIPPEAIVGRNVKDPYPQDARDIPATRRRTVYQFHKRVAQHPLLQVFDGPDASVSCGRRSVTTVAPQALALLNDPFIRARATDFARRLLSEGGTEPDLWVTRGQWLALGRAPADAERIASRCFLEQRFKSRHERDSSLARDEIMLGALADYCQTLFALNEFMYVD